MKKASGNPTTNELGNGITENHVQHAVFDSGYPLQTTVVNNLLSRFQVQEEWSYVDSDTQTIRTLDILASRDLFEFTEPQPRIRPSLDLLIECKKSELPYVFFLTQSKPWVPHFPIIAGLSSEYINLTSDDDPSTWSFRVLHVLGLESHPFLRNAPEFCTTFSKCVRKGKNIALSGSESYNGLVFPILKSLSHFRLVEQPPKTAIYFDCHLVIGLGVLDSPMVGVRIKDNGNEMELLPWVRVVRHQSGDEEDHYHRINIYALDIVHKDFLETYLEKHVLPFANVFSQFALKHQHVLAESRGFVSGLGKDSWHNIEDRLDKFGGEAKTKRYKAIGKKIFSLVWGRKNDH